jgi:hypothetical protein
MMKTTLKIVVVLFALSLGIFAVAPLTDGPEPAPPGAVQIADGPEPIPPVVALLDGPEPIPPAVAVADGPEPIPPMHSWA